ncbi:MAG: phenylalanine--tRNA ligase subunit beta [Patescibacteria group bacterium]
MNILIPHSWLLEHLDAKVGPKEMQRALSLCGPSVERIYERGGDSVYDIEVTTNRVDSMSVRGIAREAAVILKQFGHKAKLIKTLHATSLKATATNSTSLPLPKIINNPKLNTRTMCVILSNIERKATPKWMANRLEQIDMNVHDAAIDITNYVTHEIGHPCHAFDYDKLMNKGGEIHIVEANKGEKFITLDGEKFETVGGEVVFKNGKGEIIDLPSIKGTANTSVDQSTKNILLLQESINPEKVRFASMTHAIRTTAAQLMEKNLDPHLMDDNLKLGIKLYQDLCNAKQASKIYDDFSGKIKIKPVKIKRSKIENYLGIKIVNSGKAKKNQIALGRIEEILEQLGCSVKIKNKNPHLLTTDYELEVSPPTFRPDLKIPADIIEEIARIYGYHNLPSVIMPGSIPLIKQSSVNFNLENKIKRFLSNIGWQEIYTYSMVSEELAIKSGFSLKSHLKLQNPLSEDRIYLRQSLIPSLEEFVENNPLKKNLSVFEIANIYIKQKNNIPIEKMHLTLVSNNNYRKAKGDLETLFDKFYLNNLDFKQISNIQASIYAGKELVGKISILANNLVGIDIPILQLIKVAKTHPNYVPIPKTAIINEDLTFSFANKIKIGEVIDTVKSLSKLIKGVMLSGDTYKSNHTLTIYYHNPDSNISSENITPIRKKIVKEVEEKFGAKLVGEL